MINGTHLLNSIQASEAGLTLAELLTLQPAIARRTAQRLIAQLINNGQITAKGNGRVRRYFSANKPASQIALRPQEDHFPAFIPVSVDSQDILAYIELPSQMRKPVGYQRDFLDAFLD